MIKPLSIALLVLIALTLPATAQQRLYRYQCEDGKTFEAEYLIEQAQLTLAGRKLTLPQVRSASGTRYSDGQTTLFTKGTEAFIEENGTRTYSACVGQLAASQPNSAQPVRGLW